MLKELFSNRLFIGALAFFVLCVGSSLLYMHYDMQRGAAELAKDQEQIKQLTERQTSQPKAETPIVDTSQGGHFHADGTWHSEPHETIAVPVEASERFTSIPDAFADVVNPTSTSSNPLFSDGVPEHLQCPLELIGVYSNEDKEKLRSKVMPIYHEIMEKWNPNRLITDLWYPMIEAEKWYRDNADPDKAEILTGQGRVDWLVQLWLDFPEMIVLSKEDPVRFSDKVRVDMGDWSPDWNAFTLPDGSGRVFRMDYDKRYEFTWSNYTEKEDGSFTSNTFTHKTGLSGENGELVKINLDEVSDEDLERLGGWNFNINPYTTGTYKLEDKK